VARAAADLIALLSGSSRRRGVNRPGFQRDPDLLLVSLPILLLSSVGLLLDEGAFEFDRRDVAERRVAKAAVVEERRGTPTSFACSHLCSPALRPD
jgi:hypothetical protein